VSDRQSPPSPAAAAVPRAASARAGIVPEADATTPTAAAQPADGSPQQDGWTRVTESGVLDLAIAVGLTAGVFAFAGGGPNRQLVTALLVTLPVAVRHRVPLVLLAVAGAGIVVTSGAGGALAAAAFAIMAFSAGEARDRPSWSLPVAILITVPIAIALIDLDAEAWAVVTPTCLALSGWLAGDAVRGRAIATRLRTEAAIRREQEREAALRETVAEERRAMARELHDIVAHSVSVMVVQAGAARTVVASQPELAEASIGAIETTGREAMAELRRLLGVLADDGDTAGVNPATGLAQVPALVERVGQAGLPVEFRVAGTARALTPAVDVAAYRIVQEGLTNALRYAGRARTVVQLDFRPDELKVEVLDEGPGVAESGPGQGSPNAMAVGSGRGLAGLRARAEELGGRLEAGPRLGGGFAVRAWLPLAGPA